MDDFKPNSNRFKEEQRGNRESTERKKVEKVVSGPVKTKKKNELTKVKDVFISEDASNIKNYILMDVLVPAIKKALSDIVTNGIDMLLYGGENGERRKTSSDRVSYSRYYDSNRDRDSGTRTRTSYDYDDIVFNNRAEAEEVRDRMEEIIDMYGVVSVADMYDLAGISCNYTDNNYGWTTLRNAEPYRLRDGGYVLKLPKVLPIKR